MNNEYKLCTSSVFTEKLRRKWELSIIYHLSKRSLSFGQLASGIITRCGYLLTDIAKNLKPVLKSIDCWIKKILKS